MSPDELFSTYYNTAREALDQNGKKALILDTIKIAEASKSERTEIVREQMKEQYPEEYQRIQKYVEQTGNSEEKLLQDYVDQALETDKTGSRSASYANWPIPSITSFSEKNSSAQDTMEGISKNFPRGFEIYPENLELSQEDYVKGIALHEAGHIITDPAPNGSNSPSMTLTRETRAEAFAYGENEDYKQSSQAMVALKYFFLKEGSPDEHYLHAYTGLTDNEGFWAGDESIREAKQLQSTMNSAVMSSLGLENEKQAMRVLKEDPAKYTKAVQDGMQQIDTSSLTEDMIQRINITVNAINTLMIPKNEQPKYESDLGFYKAETRNSIASLPKAGEFAAIQNSPMGGVGEPAIQLAAQQPGPDVNQPVVNDPSLQQP